MDFQFQPGSSSLVATNVGADMEEKGVGEEPRVYSGRSAGGKLRLSRRSSKKATPYDRPASGRHATAGGLPTLSGSVASSSLASRLVGSASRLITSSASYFFPSLFGRRVLALTSSNPGSVQDDIVEEQDKQEEPEPFTNQESELLEKSAMDPGQEQALAAVGSEKSEKRELNLARVEDMLKQKSWSREQVSRLTDLLNTRLIEHPPTISRLAEAGFPPTDAAAIAVDSTPVRDVEVTPISEAQRWREELKRARTDCVPVEVARAYMGERTSLQSSLTRSFRGTAHQMDRIAELQPPPGLGLAEDRFRSFPVLRSKTRSPAPQLLKRGPLLDEEWMSVGPVRRTRHKMFHMNSSPYARALPNVDPVLRPRTSISTPVQSSQTARKILDTLEMLSPSPKSKFVNDEPTEIGTPDIFSIQGSRTMHSTESSKVSSLRDTRRSNGRLESASPSDYLVSTTGTKKESYMEDKSLVSRLLPSNEAGFFSSTTGFLSSSAIATSWVHSTTAPSKSIQPESKPLFSFTLSPSKPEDSSTPAGSPFAVPSPDLTVSPPTSTTSANVFSSAETPSLIPSPGRDSLAMGPDAMIKESNRVFSEQRLTSLQFGSPFAFKVGTNDSPCTAAKGLQSATRQDGPSGAHSDSPFSISLKAAVPVSPFMSNSTPVLCSVSTTATNAPASIAPALFGSLSGSPPLFKSSPSGQLFGASSIWKPAVIAPLTIEASSAPFTFSPPPALVSCSTPTFSFGSSAEPANVSFEPSKLEELNTAPVFYFTSPSGGLKLPVVACEDLSLPAPTFKFGAAASPSPCGDSVAGSGSTSSFGAGASHPSGGLVAESASITASFMGSGQVIGSGEVTGSLPQQCFKSSEQLFGFVTESAPPSPFPSPPSPFSSVESLQAPAGFEAPSFASGASGLERPGRKFFKAKRRK